MAGTVKHNDLTPVFGLTEWSAEHNFAGGAHGNVLMRDTNASDGASWQSKPYVDVRDYGAVGNGSTDDTAAIQLAITAAAGRAVLFPATSSSYKVQGGVIVITDGTSLVGPEGGSPGLSSTAPMLSRSSSGDFITFTGTGGCLRNLLLWDDDALGTRTGAAIRFGAVTTTGGVITSFSDLVRRAGFTRVENVRVSGSQAVGAWERILDIDGSLVQIPGSIGVRDLVFQGCWFFGARTASDSIRIKSGVHVMFSDCLLDPAPTAITQGITVDANSVNVSWSNLDMIGSFDSSGQYVSVTGGNISGNITIRAAALHNAVVCGQASGTPSNLSTTSMLQTTRSGLSTVGTLASAQSTVNGTVNLGSDGQFFLRRNNGSGAGTNFGLTWDAGSNYPVNIDQVTGLTMTMPVIASSIRGTAVTFANRPATPVEGMLVGITDSTTATWGATITGTGANHVLAYYNGSNWTVAGK